MLIFAVFYRNFFIVDCNIMSKLQPFCCCLSSKVEPMGGVPSDISVTTSGRLTSQNVRKQRVGGGLQHEETIVVQDPSVTSVTAPFVLHDQRLSGIDPRIASVLVGLQIPEPFATMGAVLPKIIVTDENNESRTIITARPNKQMMATLFPFYRSTKQEALKEANEELHLLEHKADEKAEIVPALRFSSTAIVNLIPQVVMVNWKRLFCCCMKQPPPEPEWPDRFLKNIDDKVKDLNNIPDCSAPGNKLLSPLQNPPDPREKSAYPKPCLTKQPKAKTRVSRIFTMFPLFKVFNHKQKIVQYLEYSCRPVRLRKQHLKPLASAQCQTSADNVGKWPNYDLKRQVINTKIAKAYKTVQDKVLYSFPMHNISHPSTGFPKHKPKMHMKMKKRPAVRKRSLRMSSDNYVTIYTIIPTNKKWPDLLHSNTHMIEKKKLLLQVEPESALGVDTKCAGRTSQIRNGKKTCVYISKPITSQYLPIPSINGIGQEISESRSSWRNAQIDRSFKHHALTWVEAHSKSVETDKIKETKPTSKVKISSQSCNVYTQRGSQNEVELLPVKFSRIKPRISNAILETNDEQT